MERGGKRAAVKEGGGTGGRGAANNKSEGLTDAMIEEITNEEHKGKLLYLLRLHELN